MEILPESASNSSAVVSKEIWDRIKLLMPGDDPITCLNKEMAFLSAVAASRFPSTNNQLRTSFNLKNQATIQEGRVIMQQVQGRQGQSYVGSGYKGNVTSSRGNNAGGEARVVKCYNCQGNSDGQSFQLRFNRYLKGLKNSTSASRAQPTDNKKNDRISKTLSSNMKNKVEVLLRRASLSSNKTNHVKDPIFDANVKHTMLNANSEFIYDKCIKLAPPSPNYVPGPEEPQTPPRPQDEDEHEPMFIQPHDPDFVPEPIYPEYMPLEDEHVLPAEEQPLPPVVSPTLESPEYVAESDPEEDPEDDSFGDDDDNEGEDEEDEDEEEEKEEEHLALADSAVVIPTDELDFPPEGTELVMPPPSTDTTTIEARITRLARCTTSAALPSPPVPPPLHMPPPVDHRDDIPKTEMPPRKRLCLSTLGSRTRISQRVVVDSQRVDLLMEDRIAYQETIQIVEEDAYAAREAWAHSIGLNKYYPQGEIKKLEIELWNLNVKENNVLAYTERFQELTLICTMFVADETEKIDKYISGLPNNIYGSVKASKSKTLDETIELANDLMDQKLCTYAERQTNNKRKADDSFKNNHGHQQNNVANPKGNGCFESGAPGHFKRDCLKLKNKDGRKVNVLGWVYAVRNAGKKGNASRDPDSNVVTGTFLLNNHYASILFDTGVDRSFISTAFSSLIDIVPTLLENSYDVELANGKIVGVDTIM
nr:hypothetical protein [Tanacetum cinerariifolium]